MLNADLNGKAHPRSRRIMILLVAAPLLLAIQQLLTFILRADAIVEGLQQCRWKECFGFDEPVFGESFRGALWSAEWPWSPHKIYIPDSVYSWVFILSIALVAWYWYYAPRTKEDSLIYALPALVPTLVALILTPRMTSSILVLAELGLRNPGAAGDMVAQALKTLVLGLLLSLLCLLGMLWSRR